MATSPTTYQVTDPTATQPDTQTQDQVAPTPSGQMPPQPGNTTMTPPGQYDNAAPPSTQGATQALAPQPDQPLQSARPDQTVTPSQPAQQQKAAPNPHIGAIMSTAEVLGGGPRYRTTVDLSTGTVNRQQLPPDKKDIVWSILLAALSGSLAGASAKGPNAAGQAAALGLQQGQNIAAQRQQAEEKQSDNVIKAAQLQQSTARYNLARRSEALAVGKQGSDENDRSITAGAPLIEQAKKVAPDAIGDEHVSAAEAQDVKKWPLGDWLRVPDGVTDRIGPEGTPVYISASGSGQVVPEGSPDAIRAVDRTYTLIKNTPVPLVDDKGTNLPWVQRAIAMGYITSNAGNIASSARIPLVRAAEIQQKEHMADQFENDVNIRRKAEGLDPINVDGDLKANHSLLDSMNAFQGQLGANGHMFLPALQAISAKDPSAANQIASYYGGESNLAKYDLQTARTKVEQGYRTNGFKSAEEAQQELTNPNASPDIKKSAQARIDSETATKAQVAGAEERAKLPGEIRLKRTPSGDAGAGLGSPTPGTGAYTPLPASKGGAAFDPTKATPAAVNTEKTVDSIHSGNSTPQEEMALIKSRGVPGDTARRDILRRFHEKYPDANYSTYEQWGDEAKNPKIKNSLSAARTLFGANGQPGTVDTLEGALKKIPTGVPIITAITNPLQFKLGSDDLAALQTIEPDVTMELSQFSATGGSQTDKRLELAAKQINPNATAGQIQAQLKVVRQAAHERMTGIVGDNPYLTNYARTINGPTSRGASVQNSQQPSANQPQKGTVPQYAATTKDGKMGYIQGQGWVTIQQ